MSDLSSWVDLIQTPAIIVAIVVLFLKKRVWFGLFGLFMTVTGVALHFPLFRVARDQLGDWWWWTWRAQGLAVLALLIVIALAPPAPGSWWARRRDRASTPAAAGGR